MKIVAFGLVAIVAIAIAVATIGARRWAHATESILDELRAADPSVPEPRSLDSLPEPVARYFQRVFTGEPPPARFARLSQVGTFRMGADESSWRPFTAQQHVDLTAPGFVWDARIAMAPFLPVRVRDAYVGGRGTMLGKILSVVTVVNEHDKEELATGALLRYLAEAAWFPTVLLPRSSLRWRAIDDASAEVMLTDAGIEVAATFHFDAAGDITGVSAERYREVDGEYELTPWRGRFWNHAVENDLRIPLEGEVAWILPKGELVYWRGKIVDYEVD